MVWPPGGLVRLHMMCAWHGEGCKSTRKANKEVGSDIAEWMGFFYMNYNWCESS